ncbi:unnamed protein product, partial [marine sediment metagenome]
VLPIDLFDRWSRNERDESAVSTQHGRDRRDVHPYKPGLEENPKLSLEIRF